MVIEEGHDRTAARPNGVGVARGLNAIAAHQGEQDGFLGDKGLDGVCALHLGRQIDLTQMNAIDGDRSHVEKCCEEFGFMRIKTGLTLAQVPCEDCATGLTNCPILVFPEL